MAAAAVAQRGNAGLAAALLDTLSPSPRVPHAPAPVPSAGPVVSPPAPAPPAAAHNIPAQKPQAPVNAPMAGGRPLLFPPRPMMPGGAPGGVPAARPIVAPRPSVAPSAITAPTSNAAPTARQSGGVVAPSPAPAPPAPASASVAAPRPVSSGPAPTGARTPINPFLANDPHAKAKRLARALVSDLVTYFPQKRQDGLRDGTLKQLFKEEIQRSYEEYVSQVGREFAESTPHFQEALNDLLAGGQKVF